MALDLHSTTGARTGEQFLRGLRAHGREVWLNGDTVGHDEVITHTNWRAHIIHQAMTRAWTKLELAFGLGHAIAETTGVGQFDHIQEKLGEIWSYLEMTRAGVVAAEAGGFRAEPSADFAPDE